MLGPYRDPGPVDADPLLEPLPDRCIPAAQGCSHRPPLPAAPLPAPSSGYARALSAAATLLLFVGSASLAANTWVTTLAFRDARAARVTKAHGAHGHGPVKMAKARPAVADTLPIVARTQPARRIPPRRSEPIPLHHTPGPSMLGRAGQETHMVDKLWRRAENLAAETGAITLARVAAARGAFDPAAEPALWVPRLRGLGVMGRPGLSGGAPRAPTPSLLGLRPGDLVTGVNGFSLRRPEDGAFAQLAMSGSAVVELTRDGRLVVLRIDWIP